MKYSKVKYRKIKSDYFITEVYHTKMIFYIRYLKVFSLLISTEEHIDSKRQKIICNCHIK